MSCIVGFINFTGEPADPEILARMCVPLKARAPDKTTQWHSGQAAIAHALLATSPEEKMSQQPCSLDGKTWISSDTHLCARDALERNITGAGVVPVKGLTEAELLLQAHHAFGPDFASNLVGDFAIAIWDTRLKKLVCARDHLGVRPLFYAHVNGVFIFGSDLEALLEHPEVSSDLDENFIADFLMFTTSLESDATVYRDIKRLPGAHYLVVDANGLRINPYWSPTEHGTIRYSSDAEYSDHFYSIFKKAVIERLPPTRVSLELTGGMDSSSIAAICAQHAQENGQQLAAHTYTCRKLIPEDKEGKYAKLIASQLNIPLQWIASEDYVAFGRSDTEALRTSEPFANSALAQFYDTGKKMVESGCRVLMSGQMGDALFAGSDTYFLKLLKSGHFSRLLIEGYEHWKRAGSLSGTRVRSVVRARIGKALGKQPWQPDKPDWLVPEFKERVKFEERWLAAWQMWSEMNDTRGQLLRPWTSSAFENYEKLRLPLIVRHPFSDIRLSEFVMSVPNHILADKQVMRVAMTGKLPSEVLCRPKEGMPGDLDKVKMQSGLCRKRPSFNSIAAYVDPGKYQAAYEKYVQSNGSLATWSSWLMIAPIALAYWMNHNAED